MLLTTEQQKPIISIKETLDTQLPLEKYGDIGDFLEFQYNGTYYYDLKVENADLMTLFLVSLDNNTMEEIKLFSGQNKLFLDLPGDNEFLILVGEKQNKSVSSVEQIDKYQTFYPPSKLNVSGIGEVNIDIPNNRYLLSTNRGKGITIISALLFGDRKYLTNYNENLKQASAITLQNLETGIYSGKLNQSKYDIKRNDLLLAYNGKNLVELMQSSSPEEKEIEIEIPYGLLYLIGADTITTSGTTEFILTNLRKSKDLSYIPPKQLPLTFNESLGRVSSNKNQAIISTGTGSRSVSTIARELKVDKSLFEGFIEGGFGTWNLDNGKYRITSFLKSSDKINLDGIFSFDEQNLTKLFDTSSATIEYSKSQNISEELLNEIEVNNGKLTILGLDSTTKTGSTELKIIKLELLELFAPPPDNSVKYDKSFNLLLIEYTLPKATSTIEFDFDGNVLPFDGNQKLVSSSINSSTIELSQDDKIKINLGDNYSQGTVLKFIINNIDSSSIDDNEDKTVDVKFDDETVIEDSLIANRMNSFTPRKAQYTNDSIMLEFDIDTEKLGQEIKTIYLDFDTATEPFTEQTTIDNGTIMAIKEDTILIKVPDNNDGKFNFTLSNINYSKITEDKSIDIGINGNDLDFNTDYPDYIRFYCSNLLTIKASEPEYLIDTTVSRNEEEIDFYLGGDVTKKSFNLRLEEYSQLDIELNPALIVEFVKDSQVEYSTEYITNLAFDLEAGNYELNLFTESSTAENYHLYLLANPGFNIYQPILREPPNPQPKTLRKLGTTKDNCFNFGVMKPWEVDDNSGKTWNKGYLYDSAHLGFFNVINSIINGEVQIFSFEIETPCYLNLMGGNGVDVAIESMGQVIGQGTGGLQLQLANGKYYVFLETQYSEPIDYQLSFYLSTDDPNYAD